MIRFEVSATNIYIESESFLRDTFHMEEFFFNELHLDEKQDSENGAQE
jgi:hypothetical protein